MKFTSLFEDELWALTGLSHEAFRLYVYLRHFVHRKDGECYGAGVTWPEIASQGLYVAPRSGVKGGGMPDKRKMMRVRDELIRHGLLESIGDSRTHLRFRFPIFIQCRDVHFSDQKQAAPNPHPEAAPNPHPENPFNTANYDGCGQQAAPSNKQQAAPYPEVPRDTYKQTDRGEAARFSITQDWRPSPTFTDMAKLSMLDIEQEHQQLYSETLAEFLMFWTSEEAAERYPNRLRRTQGEWERGLLTQVQSAKANPKQRKATPSGSRPRSRYTTKQDVIRARNQQTATGWIPPELREGANP